MARTTAASVAGESKFGQTIDTLKSWPLRAMSFYTDVRMEMKKVTTPSWKEVRATTTVVIIAVFLFGLYFYVVDKIFSRAIGRLIFYFTHR